MPKQNKPNLTAADILVGSHPLHNSLCKWVQDRAALHGVKGRADVLPNTPGPLLLTKRKARRFLTQYPQYRQNAA